MKIGISALIFQIKDALDICREYKCIRHIEIGLDNIEECKILKTYLDEIIELNLSIGIHLPMELNTCENIRYIRNSWIKFIEKINKELNDFNIVYFNMHLGYVATNRYTKRKNEYLKNSISFLNTVASILNCNLTIENTYSNGGDISNIGTSVDEFEYIFNNVNKNNIKFCYDTGHNLINKDEYMELLKNNIGLIHLSDNDGKKDMHIGIGKGILDLNHIKEIIDLNLEIMILEIDYSEIKNSLTLLERFI